MKGKFRTPIWVIPALVMVMVLGAFAVVLSINHFSATPAEALITSVTVDVDDPRTGFDSEYTITWETDEDYAGGAVVVIDFSGAGAGIDASAVDENTVEAGFGRATTLSAARTAALADLDDANATATEAANLVTVTMDADFNPPAPAGEIVVIAVKFAVDPDLDPAVGPVTNPDLDTTTNNVITVDSDQGTEAAAAAEPSGDIAYVEAVLDFEFTASPNKASALASYTLTFETPHDLVNGIDEIIITWVDDYEDFPSAISSSSVTLRAIKGDSSSCGSSTVNCGVTGTIPSTGVFTDGQAVNPQAVTLDFVGIKSKPETTLRVPDMDEDDNSGGNGIAAGATVTIVFQQSAGITNPTENADDYEVEVRVTKGGVDPGVTADVIKDDIFIQARMLADSDDGKRGDVLTLVASGIEGRESITFFRDENGNGVRDLGEVDLCSVVADPDDTATCTFTISNPPMVPDVGDDCTLPVLSNCNFINFIDATGRTTTGALGGDLDQEAVDRQKFELDQSIIVAPSVTNVGDRITVSLFDYPQGDVTKIEIAAVNVTPADLDESIPSSGERSFTFLIPGVAPDCVLAGSGVTGTDGTGFVPPRDNCLVAPAGPGDDNPNAGVRLLTGVVPFKVTAGGKNEDTNITIAGANLSISHETVLANQDLTISGNGFTEGNNVCILEGGITLNNVPLQIDDDNDCPSGPLGGAERGILLTSGGTFTITVRVEQTNGDIPTALLQEGSHELKVIDTNGAEGTILVTVAERTLEVIPLASRPRDIITIIGRHFIADNPDGLSTTVNVSYQCGANTRSVTADPDVSGNFRETLRIPSNCAIPSTNTITADIVAGTDSTGIVETATHEIPEALVRIEPSRGPSGTFVTVTGEGFRTFETVSKIEFGGLGTLGGRTENTDANGNFVVENVLVPGLDPGIHAVKIEVSTGTNRTSSSTSFEVLEPGEVGIPSALPEALEPLGDNLVRAFHFNNVSKAWTFYDPRPEFADANTLSELISSAVYWVRIVNDVEVDLNLQIRNLSCVDDDCWNLLVW